MSVQPTKDGMGLQVAVVSFIEHSTHPYAKRDTRISIYQIFPLDGEPSFSEIAVSNEVDDGRFTPLISGDRLVIKVEKRNQWHCLLVWDFLNNLWAMWDGGRPFSDVLIMWGFVLLLKHKDVWALELRNLEPRGSYRNPSPIQMEEMTVDFLLSQETKSRITGASSDLPSHETQDVIIDLISNIDRKSGHSVVQRSKMAAQTSNQAEEPSLVFQLVTPRDFEIRCGAMQYRLSEGDLVGYFLKPNEAAKPHRQLVLSIMSHTENDCFAFSKPHYRDGRGDWDLPSLCPISGRICYLIEDEEKEIVVADLCAET
ncbi:hypothetical protein AGABI1DRAFT_132363 [Agaricus bisporus var. burnettii JB137-S8]|uniref:Uncharacterized protein n=1 Tax=Agaricus bisporus var. burnettii (strain JB137-S8 / ATCC MYA-4627 / FGSC 10392) TaxID=597362 RepID=K5WXM6_AGABU|nr:uncharacterized protein AGABI1DRAFT_132363 [Agaricus bisporus var. burnettii JB137-S8]EKM75342.1 hypothetical protein AGABI1DRAFT_132363 [Agaricus bisporus var. burnettii JB137-S8]